MVQQQRSSPPTEWLLVLLLSLPALCPWHTGGLSGSSGYVPPAALHLIHFVSNQGVGLSFKLSNLIITIFVFNLVHNTINYVSKESPYFCENQIECFRRLDLKKDIQLDIALRLILKYLCSTLKKQELDFLAYSDFCIMLINKFIIKEKAIILYQRMNECAIYYTYIVCHSCIYRLQLRRWGEKKNGRIQFPTAPTQVEYKWKQHRNVVEEIYKHLLRISLIMWPRQTVLYVHGHFPS